MPVRAFRCQGDGDGARAGAKVGDLVRVELAQRNGQVVLSIADDGEGIEGDDGGTGLSIVRALVRDELRGTLDLVSDGGLRAEVVFPA